MAKYTENGLSPTMSSVVFLSLAVPFGFATAQNADIPPLSDEIDGGLSPISFSESYSPTLQGNQHMVTHQGPTDDENFSRTMLSFFSKLLEDQVEIPVEITAEARKRLWELY